MAETSRSSLLTYWISMLVQIGQIHITTSMNKMVRCCLIYEFRILEWLFGMKKLSTMIIKEMVTKKKREKRNHYLNILLNTGCSTEITPQGCRRLLNRWWYTVGLLKRIGNGDDGKQYWKDVVYFSSLLATEKGIFQCYEQVNGVADVETDGEKFKEHVDVVIWLAEILVSR